MGNNKKNNINNIKNQIKRVISLVIIMAMLATSMPLDFISDGWSAIKEVLAEDEVVVEPVSSASISDLQSAVELYKAWCENPQNYQYTALSIALTGDVKVDFTSDEFNNALKEAGITDGFKGFGTESYPFRGTLKNSGNIGEYISLDTPLFEYLSDSAEIGTSDSNGSIKLQPVGTNVTAILTKNYVHDDRDTAQTGSVYLDIYNDDSSSFGGIVSTMIKASVLNISIVNANSSGKTTLSGSKNLGLLCGTMEENTTLNFAAYSGGDYSFSVTTTDGYAGALVGSMAANSTLMICSDFTQFSGVISSNKSAGGLVGRTLSDAEIIINDDLNIYGASITSKAEAAGGLIGYGENVKINISNGKTVSVASDDNASTTIGGNTYSGGIVGQYVIDDTQSASEGDAASDSTGSNISNIFCTTQYKINNPQFTGGTSGGLFGKLQNLITSSTLTISNEADGNQAKSSSQDSSVKNIIGSSNNFEGTYGGLIGEYTSNSLASTLYIHDMDISSDLLGNVKNYSGVIGSVNSSTYVEFDDITVTTNKNSKTVNSYYGGVVAQAGSNVFFNIGNVCISGNYSATKASGGLAGYSEGGVIRLYGTTDLSDSKAENVSRTTGQLVGTRNNTLVYSYGDGNGSYDNATGWLFKRSAAVSVSDIGDWGEVIRTDGKKLSETTDSTDTASLFYRNGHTVTIQGCISGTGTINGSSYSLISSDSEFVAYALSYQFSGLSSGQTAEDSLTVLNVKNEVLLTYWLAITADIDLSGTGLTGFTRDNTTDLNDNSDTTKCKFKGYFTSESNYSIKLATGEAYGMRGDSLVSNSSDGSGQIYDHSFIGLFGQSTSNNNSTCISNITIAGEINFGLVSSSYPVYAGAVCGYQPFDSIQSYKDITVKTSISYNGTGSSLPNAYVGGILGYARYGSTVNIEECTFDASINNTASASTFYNSGLIAFIENSDGSTKVSKAGTVSIKEASVKGKLTSTVSTSAARVGAILASTGSNSKVTEPAKTTITIENVNIDDFTIESNSSGTVGGFLGYEWRNTDVTITGLSIGGASKLDSKNALFGGLVYAASGNWTIKNSSNTSDGNYTDKGVEYGEKVTISGKTSDTNPSGLLVARGDNYVYSDDSTSTYAYALYLSIQDEDAYVINNSAMVTLTSNSNVKNNYFDELVGRSITANSTNKNGVVSIKSKSDNSNLIDQSGCNTYSAKLITSYSNPYTRYYYNLDEYRLNENGETVTANATLNTGKNLLLWSVGQYCESNLTSYFTSSRGGKVTITGNIDLTGLSYYPIDYTGNVTIENSTITFDFEGIEMAEVDNKKPSDNTKQHYMMQDGLFLTLTSTTAAAASLTISGEDGLKLCGTIGQLSNDDYDGGSGALICGKAEGVLNDTIANTFTFSIGSQSSIKLSGLYVSALDDYAPMLINQIGKYSSLNVLKISTEEYNAATIAAKKAATSLIGKVGSQTDTNIVLLFEDIDLDGHSSTSIFSRATLLESFSYSTADLVSSGSYNFNKADTFTYGKEISNGINGTTGRNPYNSDEGTGQIWYYDTFGSDDGVVTEDLVAANVEKGFTENYLPYVKVSEGTTEADSYKHELDINQYKENILKGCGTYDDPYIIDKDGQLETIANFIASGSISGWSINIDYSVAKNKESFAIKCKTEINEPDDEYSYSHYTYKSGSTWKIPSDATYKPDEDDDNDYSLDSDEVRAYLRNAYYMVTEDVTLSSNFYGLGGSDPEKSVFSGVIVGKLKEDSTYPTITISTHTSTTHYYFGGLIAFSQGSVVKNLNINYSNVTVTIKSQAPSQERENQSFFGGVIGYVVGGDNIIDNVEVTGLTQSSLIINGSDGTENGTYAQLTAVGGYVGLVGGNTQSGGGVVFRNLDGNGLTGSDYEENSTYYYRNPFVGRVLDGYACAESCTLDNTDKNYTIPTLTLPSSDAASTEQGNTEAEEDNAEVEQGNKESKIKVTLSGTTGTVTIASAQQLWVLSAIVNSGAGGMNISYKYNSDAYDRGCVRTGTYDYVGSTGVDEDDEGYSNYEKDLNDCNYWGGTSYSKSTKLSYLVSQYAESNAAYTTGGSNSYGITFTADCDMSSYGNGFRGIGSTYQDNYDSSKIMKRTIYLGGSVGGISENQKYTVTIKRNIKEYAVEQGVIYASTDVQSNPGWWAQGIGLFPVVNFNAATTVQYLNISGDATITYSGDDTYIGEASAGGLAGLTANRGSDKDIAVTFNDVDTINLTVTGSKYAGGLIGVFGKSSRTLKNKPTDTKGTLLTVSTRLGNVTFKKCDYSYITISGGYSAGGYFGTYYNAGKTTTLTGPCTYQDSDISWNNDACLEMYTVTKDSSKAKTDGYSGAAGLIGYYYAGAFNINTSSSNSKNTLIFKNITISAPQFAYNCDYGLGALTGLQCNGTLTAYYVNAENVTVQINIKENYEGKFGDKTYYLAPASGVLVGYAKSEVKIFNSDIDNSRVVNAGYAGGVIGCASTTFSIKDSSISNTVVYTKGAASYDGAPKAGGIAGNATKGFSARNITMKNDTVIGDGRVGLIIGYTRNEGTQNITGFSADNCTVATTQNEVAPYYITSNTDPGDRSTLQRSKDNSAGTAGLILGVVSSGGSYTKLNSLKAFNLQFSDCIVGYYVGGSTLTYTKSGDTWGFNRAVDETSIGVYTGTDSGIPYSELTGDKAMSETNQYTKGGIGKLIGGTSKINTMKIVGLSIQGGYYPYYENGYGDSNTDINTSNTSYIIYADYNGTSTGDEVNTEGTINSTYTTSTAASSPYVVVNPSSELTVYNAITGTDKSALLTGDGTVLASRDAILNDLCNTTGSTASKPYHMAYNHISSIAKKFMSDDTSTTEASSDEDSANGIYEDKLGTYYDASESDITTNNYSGSLKDFPVLVIDSTDTSEITDIVNSYISLLTNCDQTGLESGKSIYNNITVQTYQWNSDNKRFVAAGTNSLIYNSTDKTLSVNGNLHDNQNNQFTLLDVVYFPDKVYDVEGYFHLYIPVVVKKVLQVDFNIKMLTGSTTYSSAYNSKSSSTVLAGYGENYTTQLTYTYTWTAAEWNNYISSGNSLFFSYDKQVQLATSAGYLSNNTTRYTLVDVNSYGKVLTYTTGQGDSILSNSTVNKSDAVLEFNSFTDFTSVPICDLMDFIVEEDGDGVFKLVGTGSADEIPSDATLRIWNGTDFTYYGPKTAKDDSSTQYYNIRIKISDSSTEYDGTKDVLISETYYLTINCENGTGVETMMAQLGLNKRMTSESSNAIPTKINNSGVSYYTLGDYYKIDDVSIVSEAENSTQVIETPANDYINVTATAGISLATDYNTFNAYAKDQTVYFRFALNLVDKNNGITSIDSNTIISIESIQLKKVSSDSSQGDSSENTVTTVSADSYEGNLYGGTYYITVALGASDFIDSEISANIHFGYDDDANTISTQFPEKTTENSDVGVFFTVDSAISFDENTIDGSAMSGNAEDKTNTYYREKIEVVSLSYNAYNTVSEDGNTSQLGINGRELNSDGNQTGQTISTLGMFNATAVSSLNLTDAKADNYPSQLVCTLSLQKKVDIEDTDGNIGTAYRDVNDIRNFISNYEITSGSDSISDEGCKGNDYSFTVNLSEEQVKNLDSEQLELAISYFVIGDGSLENVNDASDTAVYANYRVILTAYLANSKGEALTDKADDYLIYTNCEFYLGILSTGDFDD